MFTMPLVKSDVQMEAAALRPGLFLHQFAQLLDKNGSDILVTLFALAKGRWSEPDEKGERILLSDPKDVLSAIKTIIEVGAFKDVVKHLLKVSKKGRPRKD